MINLLSVDTIKKHHNFVEELQMIPAVDWVKSEQMENYDDVLKQTAKKLKVIDNILEIILSNPEDEDITLVLERTFYRNKLSSVKNLKFQTYLPQGKIQLQRDLIKMSMEMAQGKKSIAKDLNKEMGECRYQAEWEVNPRIGTVLIDDNKTELRLHDSIELFLKYLDACEHEFYKQNFVANLPSISHEYHMFLEELEFNGKKPKFRLIDEDDYLLNYRGLIGIASTIYYRHARDYFTECKKFWDFLDGNEYSKKYLLRFEDVHPGVKILEKSRKTQS